MFLSDMFVMHQKSARYAGTIAFGAQVVRKRKLDPRSTKSLIFGVEPCTNVLLAPSLLRQLTLQ